MQPLPTQSVVHAPEHRRNTNSATWKSVGRVGSRPTPGLWLRVCEGILERFGGHTPVWEALLPRPLLALPRPHPTLLPWTTTEPPACGPWQYPGKHSTSPTKGHLSWEPSRSLPLTLARRIGNVQSPGGCLARATQRPLSLKEAQAAFENVGLQPTWVSTLGSVDLPALTLPPTSPHTRVAAQLPPSDSSDKQTGGPPGPHGPAPPLRTAPPSSCPPDSRSTGGRSGAFSKTRFRLFNKPCDSSNGFR